MKILRAHLGLVTLALLSAGTSPVKAQVLIEQPPVRSQSQSPNVALGVDVLQDREFDILRGKRVGLVTNQSGRNRAGQATIDVLRQAPDVKLIALYGPEHGVRGTAEAGAHVDSGHDPITKLPVYSLYGATREPNATMLKGVQVLVFDIQEIGSRSYTFLATLEKCRQACAKQKIPFVVLDRPNPLGGAMEGNTPGKFSFVCPFPMPYRHGLTIGEVAKWLNARAALKCNLMVVPMQNYTRQPYDQMDLRWTRTSPNIPRSTSAFFYGATGLLGELPAISIGIGTPWPFELAGAPNLNANALAANLNARKLPGWTFRAASWIPQNGRYSKKRCNGVQIILTDASVAQNTRLNFEIFDAVRRVAPSINFFKSKRNNQMFDLVCGTTQIRGLMQAKQSPATIWKVWNQGATNFRKQTAQYRLYD